MMPPWVPLVAALLGALAAGLFQIINGILDRRRRRKAVLMAIASEVAAICQGVRAEGYIEDIEALLAAVEADQWDGTVVTATIRSNHFTVYEALASSLGELEPEQAGRIVRFYSMCKYAVDVLKPDNSLLGNGRSDHRLAHLKAVRKLVAALLTEGAEITSPVLGAAEKPTLVAPAEA